MEVITPKVQILHMYSVADNALLSTLCVCIRDLPQMKDKWQFMRSEARPPLFGIIAFSITPGERLI